MWANKHPLEDSILQVWPSQTEFELLMNLIIIMAVATLPIPKIDIVLPIRHLFVILTWQ